VDLAALPIVDRASAGELLGINSIIFAIDGILLNRQRKTQLQIGGADKWLVLLADGPAQVCYDANNGRYCLPKIRAVRFAERKLIGPLRKKCTLSPFCRGELR